MKRDFVIGSLHRAAPPIHHDQDAIKLQAALLGHKAPIDWDGLAIVAAVLFAIGAVAWRLA